MYFVGIYIIIKAGFQCKGGWAHYAKSTPDYDNVFKTMKMKHKGLLIPVINDIFGKGYPMDTAVDLLPLEGDLTENGTGDGGKGIEEQVSDFLVRVGDEAYLLEGHVWPRKKGQWGNYVGIQPSWMPTCRLIFSFPSNHTASPSCCAQHPQ